MSLKFLTRFTGSDFELLVTNDHCVSNMYHEKYLTLATIGSVF